MIPSIGRIVHYRLTENDVALIASQRDGTVKTGNAPREGDVYPLIITRVWEQDPTEASAINGQVLLDGNDTLWVTSRKQGDELGNWFAPPRV